MTSWEKVQLLHFYFYNKFFRNNDNYATVALLREIINNMGGLKNRVEERIKRDGSVPASGFSHQSHSLENGPAIDFLFPEKYYPAFRIELTRLPKSNNLFAPHWQLL